MNVLIKQHENNLTEMKIFCLKAITSAKILPRQIQKTKSRSISQAECVILNTGFSSDAIQLLRVEAQNWPKVKQMLSNCLG